MLIQKLLQKLCRITLRISVAYRDKNSCKSHGVRSVLRLSHKYGARPDSPQVPDIPTACRKSVQFLGNELRVSDRPFLWHQFIGLRAYRPFPWHRFIFPTVDLPSLWLWDLNRSFPWPRSIWLLPTRPFPRCRFIYQGIHRSGPCGVSGRRSRQTIGYAKGSASGQAYDSDGPVAPSVWSGSSRAFTNVDLHFLYELRVLFWQKRAIDSVTIWTL